MLIQSVGNWIMVTVNENNIIHGDAFKLIKKIKNESVDLICTDPPYGTTDLSFDAERPPLELYTELKRILKPNGWFFCFGTMEMFCDILQAGWRRKFEYICIKPAPIPITHNTIRPMNKHEIIIACIKPELKKVTDLYYDKKAIRTKGVPYSRAQPANLGHFTSANRIRPPPPKEGFTHTNDGIREPTSVLSMHSTNRLKVKERYGHPTQKSLAILDTIVKGYCPPKGLVFDPFAGSGTALISAHKNGRNYLGFEINKEYYDIIQRRFAELLL